MSAFVSRDGISFEKLSDLLDKICFNNYLGIRLVRFHAEGVEIECPLRPELMNAAGVLHGGVAATMADVAVGMALTRHLGGTRAATTVELKINYLRPVTGGKIVASSHLLKVGSSLCVGRVDLTDAESQLVGAALVTYMLLGQR
jgi:uncharacterized protein (TIGR00369 family)